MHIRLFMEHQSGRLHGGWTNTCGGKTSSKTSKTSQHLLILGHRTSPGSTKSVWKNCSGREASSQYSNKHLYIYILVTSRPLLHTRPVWWQVDLTFTPDRSGVVQPDPIRCPRDLKWLKCWWRTYKRRLNSGLNNQAWYLSIWYRNQKQWTVF